MAAVHIKNRILFTVKQNSVFTDSHDKSRGFRNTFGRIEKHCCRTFYIYSTIAKNLDLPLTK